MFFILYLLSPLAAQSSYRLSVIPLDKEAGFLEEEDVEFRTVFPDTGLVSAELLQIIGELHDRAFFEASFDSIAWGDSLVNAWLHVGDVYEWAQLYPGNIEEEILDRSGFRQRLYNGKPVSISQIEKLKEAIVSQAENNGYPFAEAWIDSLVFTGPSVSAQLMLDKGKLVFFDSLNVSGDVKITETYLRNYLGIKQGEPYSRKRVLRIRDRLRELPFLQEKKNATIRFLDDRASVNLTLEKKRASRFDFLLGVLPDNGRPENKLLITGTFNAEMHNQFGLGERIFLSFERLRPQTQELELEFSYPYLLDLPFGVDLIFNQYKRDSTYTDVIGDFGVKYLLEGGNYLKAFWRTTSSNLITVDTNAIRQGRFPELLDVRNNAFGLEGNWQQLDYRFNPRRGWAVLLRGSAGTRQILRNQAILNIDESFYDTLPDRTFRFTLDGEVQRFLPVLERSAIKLAARSGAIISEEPVYQNEQYRIGGNRLLRGFDEESIFATFFTVFTAEYRLLVGQNSYFYLFGDYAYLEDRRVGKQVRYDRPLGFGAGLTFETTAGVFGISMAIGQREGAPADFRNPKIHFGYVSIF